MAQSRKLYSSFADPDRWRWRAFNRHHFSCTNRGSQHLSSDHSIYLRKEIHAKRISPYPQPIHKTQDPNLQTGYIKSSYQILARGLQNRASGNNICNQNCDLLFFNGVGILAGGFFYGCSGVTVYDRRWEARDGFGFVLINTNGMQAESATWSRLTKRRILMNTHQHRLKETWSKSLSDHWEGKTVYDDQVPGAGTRS